MLAGLRLGLYDLGRLCPLLAAWDDLVTRKGYTGEEVPAALAKLTESCAGTVDPPMHVFCRVPLSEVDHGTMASVRHSHILEACLHEDDVKDLRRHGIDLKARPGTASYRRSLEAAVNSGSKERRLRSGKSLTDPRRGDRAIFWYTKHQSLESVLARCARADDWADTVRDKLGLIDYETDVSIATVELPAEMTDDREDRGRPTFVEGCVHRRFRCDDGSESGSPWGKTVDLGAVTGPATARAAGLPERVCGRVPGSATHVEREPRLRMRFLGAPRFPRSDEREVADEHFARLLEYREAEKGGAPLADQLADLCERCDERLEVEENGHL